LLTNTIIDKNIFFLCIVPFNIKAQRSRKVHNELERNFSLPLLLLLTTKTTETTKTTKGTDHPK